MAFLSQGAYFLVGRYKWENTDNRYIMTYTIYFRKLIIMGGKFLGREVGWDSKHKRWVQPWIGPKAGGFREKKVVPFLFHICSREECSESVW